MSKIIGAGEWLEKYERICKDVMVAMLLGKYVEGVSDTEMEDVGESDIY